MAIITLTTDFGVSSPYVAQMKGIILSRCASAVVVDVTHAVPPQNIRQAAIVLHEILDRFPAGTVHVVVVDPGVGTERAIVAAEIAQRWVIGPDNGLLHLAADRWGVSQAVRLANPHYWETQVSATFHGRDIMAPVAAHVAQRQSLAELGPPHMALQPLEWPLPRRQGDGMAGEVVLIDAFGNAITNIPRRDCPSPMQPSWSARCAGRELPCVETYGQRPPGTAVSLFGSGGWLEVAVVNGDAAETLGLQCGDPVVLHCPDRPTSAG